MRSQLLLSVHAAKEMIVNESMTLTVQEVLDLVPRLGIPHFQRGLVWGNESIAALLESLYLETPCGSFVFWSPEDCASKGVPLDGRRCTDIQYLIIDGQQRIRSLDAAFRGLPEGLDEDAEDGHDDLASGAKRVWCINLTKEPNFAHLVEPHKREFSLFVYTTDPAARQDLRRPSPLIHNLLPLQVVLATESWFGPALQPYRDLFRKRTDRPDAEADAVLEKLYDRLHTNVLAIKQRPFWVSVQRKDDLAEMANLYNRINSGGKRVEMEERAFAKLVGSQPNTYEELARLFKEIHAECQTSHLAETPRSEFDRDTVLQRQKERAFGFKLFIRVFLQVCQQHFGYRPGKTDFSFDLVSKDAFNRKFKQLTSDQCAWLWSETRRVLTLVRSVLRDELWCDDLRFLPETNSLTPVMQLLIHFPALGEDKYRPLLATTCLRLVLAQLDARTTQELAFDAADPRRVVFDVILDTIQFVNRGPSNTDRLSARLRTANSIQDRYVLLLYWLERRLGARDFRYANVKSAGSQLNGSERMLEERAEPEKQHIVPFSKAREFYGDGVRRGASHAFNNIGNLTYISRELNSFEGGLGDDFVDLASEPSDNQRAHLLGGGMSNCDVISVYDELRDVLSGQKRTDLVGLRKTFERMTRLRRDVIQDGFQRWIDELDAAVCKQLGILNLSDLAVLSTHAGRPEPAPPMFSEPGTLDPTHIIRQFPIERGSQDRLIALARRARLVLPGRSAKPHVTFYLTKRNYVKVRSEPEGASLLLDKRISTGSREQILDAIGHPMTMNDKIPLDPVPDFGKLLDTLASLSAKIEEEVKAAP